MTWLSSIFTSKTSPSPITSQSISQLLGLIHDIQKYLNTRLYQPNAKILQIQSLSRHSNKESSSATFAIKQFFDETKNQLETYVVVISALEIQPNNSYYKHIKTETLLLLQDLIVQCQVFSNNASLYSIYEQDGTLKRFLNHTLKNHLATLESLSKPN